MKRTLTIIVALLTLCSLSCRETGPRIFDVHLHSSADPLAQRKALKEAGVYKVAISSSWELQQQYRDNDSIVVLQGLMFPCPGGKVPYSLQSCFAGNMDWPPIAWVEEQLKAGKIDFLGEILSQYYGISPSDTLLFPYYQLASKYNIPVGIHTGGAGPDHGSAQFKMEMGDPALLRPVLKAFPSIKLWIMHAGDQHFEETIRIMKEFEGVYADISVLSNPRIVPAPRFSTIMKTFIDAELEDRIMFGSDNGEIREVISTIEALDFISSEVKTKIFFRNAERFFTR